MVNTIFCAHGRLAGAMLDSVQMIYGDVDCAAVEFLPGENVDDLMVKLDRYISQQPGEEWLISVDLQCGSPWNAAAQLAMNNSNIRVISGLSLPLALELVDNKSSMNIEQICQHLTQIAQQTCVVWQHLDTTEEDF